MTLLLVIAIVIGSIGIVSCLGAFGGFVSPLLLGYCFSQFGLPAWAYTSMALFAVVCTGIESLGLCAAGKILTQAPAAVIRLLS